MKKIVIGVLSAAFLLGGTYTFAQASEGVDGKLNFGQMKPQMQEMHPDLSTKELKEMYESCHGKDGMMQNTSSMMDSL